MTGLDYRSPSLRYSRQCHRCGKHTFQLLEDVLDVVVQAWRHEGMILETYRCPAGELGFHLTNVSNKLHKRRKRQYGDDFDRRIELTAWLFVLRAADADTQRKVRARRARVEAALQRVPAAERTGARDVVPVSGTTRHRGEGGETRAQDPRNPSLTSTTRPDIVGSSKLPDNQRQEQKVMSERVIRIVALVAAIVITIAALAVGVALDGAR